MTIPPRRIIMDGVRDQMRRAVVLPNRLSFGFLATDALHEYLLARPQVYMQHTSTAYTCTACIQKLFSLLTISSTNSTQMFPTVPKVKVQEVGNWFCCHGNENEKICEQKNMFLVNCKTSASSELFWSSLHKSWHQKHWSNKTIKWCVEALNA